LKKTIIILLILIVSAFIGIIFYNNYYGQKPELWQMVPGNAVAVYENRNIHLAWDRLTQSDFWSSFESFEKFDNLNKMLQSLDTIGKEKDFIDKMFKNNLTLISFHITASDKADIILYTDISVNNVSSLIYDQINPYLKKKNYSLKQRIYQETTIYDIYNSEHKNIYSFLIYKKILCGSSTSFLIEDVIRNINESYQNAFINNIQQLKYVSKLEKDEGNLYIDLNKMEAISKIIFNPKAFDFPVLKKSISGSLFFDIKITDKEVLFNGVIQNPNNSNTLLSSFDGQNSKEVKAAQFMPDRTAWLIEYTFTDPKNFFNHYIQYRSSIDDPYLNAYLDFDRDNDFPLDWIDNEIALAGMEIFSEGDGEKLLFVKTKNLDETRQKLNTLVKTVNINTNDSTFSENFSQHTITQLAIQEWPAILFGGQFTGFENSFYTFYQNYLVIGNSMEAVKRLIRDLENENVWGKSIQQSLFLENTLNESNINYYFNTNKLWKEVLGKLNSSWQETFEEKPQAFKAVDKVAFQIANLDNRYYASLSIGYNKNTKPAEPGSRFSKESNSFSLSPIISRPFLVKNHNTHSFETLFQDSLNILYLVSDEGEILWADSLPSKITTEIHQIDFYKNGKLQYLFATEHAIHLYDRNGDIVDGYPIKLNSGVSPEYLSVIDYDNSKKYRFMLADKSGGLYLYSKERENLEGWAPHNINVGLTAPPLHIRVKGGDCMIALTKTGVLHIMNRRGEYYHGFPVELQNRVLGGMFVNIGSNFATTYITTVTENGAIISVNLRGEIVKREQLAKSTKESVFWLVEDALQKTFVIAIKDYSKITILNQEGKELFSKNFISTGDLSIQYYNFGFENELFAINDKEQEFTFVLNGNGQMLSFEPIESTNDVAILYFNKQEKYNIYKCYGKNLQIISFNR